MKLKQSTALLLAAVLILLGGFLPRLVGNAQDMASIGKTEYAQLRQIHLDIDTRDGAELNMTAKIAILKDFAGSLELPDSMAEMTTKELRNLAQDTAAQYYDAGLLPYSPKFDSTDIGCQAFLVYWDSERAWSNIYWRIRVAYNGGGTLELIVDDETGTVCTVSFHDNMEPDSADGYIYDVGTAIETFCWLYLEGLGEEFSKYDPESVSRKYQNVMAYEGDTDYSAVTTEISWGDLIFGETTIFFAVDPHGFYTVII